MKPFSWDIRNLIAVLLAALLPTSSVFADSDSLVFSGECTFNHHTQSVSESFRLESEGERKLVKLNKLKIPSSTGSYFVTAFAETTPEGKVSLGYSYISSNADLIENKTTSESAKPGSKVAFHQQLTSVKGLTLDCSGAIE